DEGRVARAGAEARRPLARGVEMHAAEKEREADGRLRRLGARSREVSAAVGRLLLETVDRHQHGVVQRPGRILVEELEMQDVMTAAVDGALNVLRGERPGKRDGRRGRRTAGLPDGDDGGGVL